MTKADIVERIHSQLGIPKRESAEILESVLEILKQTLANGEKIKIAGFGVFTVKQKHDRRGRNPQTGETIIIDSRRVLTFKPSQVLKAAINVETPFLLRARKGSGKKDRGLELVLNA